MRKMLDTKSIIKRVEQQTERSIKNLSEGTLKKLKSERSVSKTKEMQEHEWVQEAESERKEKFFTSRDVNFKRLQEWERRCWKRRAKWEGLEF